MLVSPKLHKVILFFGLIIFINTACDKNNENNDGWKNCTECTIDSWVGEYKGKGDFSNLNNFATANDVDVSITIEQTGTDYLTVYFQAPSYYSSTVSGDLSSPDIIIFAGSSSSLSGIMLTKDGGYKLTGTAKKFHYEAGSLVVDETITFETIKN